MDDLISRQAAIDAIERLILPQVKGETAAEEINRVAWRCAINCAEEMIGHLPSAERRGRWEDVAHAPNGLYYATCSVCGKRQTTEATNYCGNCGERMVEERMIRAINAREAVEFLRENDLTITRCKSCNQHKDIDNRCYCHKLEMYVDVDWFCKDAKADKCATCFIPMFYNLEDDDSICRDCEAEE